MLYFLELWANNLYYFQYRPNYTSFYGGNNLHYMPGKTGNNTSEIPLKVP